MTEPTKTLRDELVFSPADQALLVQVPHSARLNGEWTFVNHDLKRLLDLSRSGEVLDDLSAALYRCATVLDRGWEKDVDVEKMQSEAREQAIAVLERHTILERPNER